MPKAALGRVPLCIDGPLIVFSSFLEQSVHVLLEASTFSVAWEEMTIDIKSMYLTIQDIQEPECSVSAGEETVYEDFDLQTFLSKLKFCTR